MQSAVITGSTKMPRPFYLGSPAQERCCCIVPLKSGCIMYSLLVMLTSLCFGGIGNALRDSSVYRYLAIANLAAAAMGLPLGVLLFCGAGAKARTPLVMVYYVLPVWMVLQSLPLLAVQVMDHNWSHASDDESSSSSSALRVARHVTVYLLEGLLFFAVFTHCWFTVRAYVRVLAPAPDAYADAPGDAYAEGGAETKEEDSFDCP